MQTVLNNKFFSTITCLKPRCKPARRSPWREIWRGMAKRRPWNPTIIRVRACKCVYERECGLPVCERVSRATLCTILIFLHSMTEFSIYMELQIYLWRKHIHTKSLSYLCRNYLRVCVWERGGREMERNKDIAKGHTDCNGLWRDRILKTGMRQYVELDFC